MNVRVQFNPSAYPYVVVCKNQRPLLTRCSPDRIPPLRKNNFTIDSNVLLYAIMLKECFR